MSRGTRDSRHVGAGGQSYDDQPDVLLGTVRVPLVKLLTRRTGIRGWYAIHPPDQGCECNPAACDDVRAVVGGLDLSLKFAESDDRDDVIHKARALGWSPPRGCEVEDWDEADEEDQSCVAGGVALCFKVDKAWIPLSAAGEGKTEKSLVAYARYKFYDKRPVCTRLAKLRAAAAGQGVCDLRHSSRLVLPASPSLVWFLREERLEVQLWLGKKARHDDRDWELPRRRDRLVGSAHVDLSSLVLRHARRIAQISGLFPLFKAGADDLRGACVHVQIEAAQPGAKPRTQDAQQGERAEDDDVSSDEYVSSEPRDDSVETSSMMSSGDRLAPPRKSERAKEETAHVFDSADRNTFPAHVVIERALHLPTVVGPQGGRVKPNVYVSYQVTSSSRPECTPVMCACTSPLWEYQKLQRLAYSLASEATSLHFKVWHKTGAQQQVAAAQQVEVSGAPGPDTPSTDHVIGFASVDLAPLSAGMRQLNGWYNIVDFNGQCKGQLKVGIIPVTPLSPSRCLTRSILKGISPNENITQVPQIVDAPVGSSGGTARADEHERDVGTGREQLVDMLSGQLEMHLESLRRLRSTHAAHEPDEPAATDASELSAWANSSCSTSLLFSQLRHNMKELDELQKGLQFKLSKLDGNTRVADTSNSHVVINAEGTEYLPAARPVAPTAAATSDANRRREPETLELDNHPHGTEPETLVETSSMTRSLWVQRNGSIDPVVGQQFAQSDSKNRHSDDERGREEPRSDVSGSGERTLDDCAVFTGDARLGSKEDVRAPREGSPAAEDCSSKEDSDSLGEISYINDNTTGRYAQEKDSWISSDEDETRGATPPRDENHVLPPATDVTKAIHYITSLDPARHGLSSGLNEKDREIYEADQGGNGGTNAAVASDVDKLIPEDFQEKPAPRKKAEQAVSDDELLDASPSNERDISKPQSSVPAIPNFFMPTEQLEQSMRALRLAASFHPAAPGLEDTTRSKSKLLSRSAARTNGASGGLAEEFAKRRLVYRERADPPITSDEAHRIARIFSSKNSI